MLVDLRPQNQQQDELDLFGDNALDAGAPGQESPRLMEAVDALNRRFGKGAVTVAGAQHQRRHAQHVGRQLRRSPRSTTRLGAIAAAHA
ncbi:MAG: DUF4113 domain-containing protein [Pseudomonadota bacterium]